MHRRLAGVSANQILILIAAALLVYLALGTAGKIIQTYQLQQEEAQRRAEIRALEERNRALQQKIDDAKSDAAVEKVAREELNYIKPGETGVVVVVPVPPASLPTSEPGFQREDRRPNWQRWWDIFFGPRR